MRRRPGRPRLRAAPGVRWSALTAQLSVLSTPAAGPRSSGFPTVPSLRSATSPREHARCSPRMSPGLSEPRVVLPALLPALGARRRQAGLMHTIGDVARPGDMLAAEFRTDGDKARSKVTAGTTGASRTAQRSGRDSTSAMALRCSTRRRALGCRPTGARTRTIPGGRPPPTRRSTRCHRLTRDPILPGGHWVRRSRDGELPPHRVRTSGRRRSPRRPRSGACPSTGPCYVTGAGARGSGHRHPSGRRTSHRSPAS